MNSAIYSQPVEVRHKLPPIKSLTSLRFFAAIYVVLFHESANPGHFVFFPLAARFVASGYTAVTLFFVLSGFILAYNYGRIRSRKEFWISRFARIYPVYFLSLHRPQFALSSGDDLRLLRNVSLGRDPRPLGDP